MDKLKQHQTAEALAGVILLFSLLKHSIELGIIALVLIVSSALGLFYVYWLVKAWEKLTHFIGEIVGKVLLSMVYFIFVTPLAWLFRIFNKELFNKFFAKNRQSYYYQPTQQIPPKSLENLW